MSLKTRRRKIGSQPSAKRVDRRRRAAARFFQTWASGWFDRKSMLDQLRKCDQPVSGEPIFGVGPSTIRSETVVVRRDNPSKSRVAHRHFWYRNPDGTITEKEQIGDGPWVELKRPASE